MENRREREHGGCERGPPLGVLLVEGARLGEGVDDRAVGIGRAQPVREVGAEHQHSLRARRPGVWVAHGNELDERYRAELEDPVQELLPQAVERLGIVHRNREPSRGDDDVLRVEPELPLLELVIHVERTLVHGHQAVHRDAVQGRVELGLVGRSQPIDVGVERGLHDAGGPRDPGCGRLLLRRLPFADSLDQIAHRMNARFKQLDDVRRQALTLPGRQRQPKGFSGVAANEARQSRPTDLGHLDRQRSHEALFGCGPRRVLQQGSVHGLDE